MINHEEIKKEAKDIMDNFITALKGIDIEDEFVLDRDISMRKENNNNNGNTSTNNDEFKQRFLSNAKEVSGDYIVANKGEWVK